MTSGATHKPNVPITQDQLAQSFVDGHSAVLRYDHSRGVWFRWNGKLWVEDHKKATLYDIRQHIDQSADAGNQSMRTAAFMKGVETYALADPRVAVVSEIWNRDKLLLGTPNGTVELRDGSVREPMGEGFMTRSVAIRPADTAYCPRWLEFLREATGGDKALIAYLQRLCGYALTGETREHFLCFIHGPGGNGKSVFINTLKGIMGSYAEVAAMETFTASRFDPHPTAVAKLDGARVVIASETEENRSWRTSLIKQLTGGDPISARYMRQDYFVYTPQFTLIIVGNHAPEIGTVDEAITRRFHVVPFNNKPESIDQKLEEKLMLEWPGILRWMIDGAVIWQQTGIKPPAAVTDATEQYFEQENIFGQWVEECCEFGPDKIVPVKDAFRLWKEFAKDRDHNPGTERSFTPKMQQLGLSKKTRSVNGKPTKVWVGVSLNGC